MATVLNSVSPTANPCLICTRNAHEFMYNLPNLHFVSLKKGVSRILASNTQMSVTPKKVFVIPDWKGGERDDTRTKELLLYDAYKRFEYEVGLGHKPDSGQGDELFCALYEWGDWEKAIRVVEMMLTSGVMPKLRVAFLCYKGKVGYALELVQKLEKYGFQTNNKVYTTLAKGFSKQRSLSLQVLRMLKRKGLVLDANTYSFLLEAVCREMGADEAMSVLDEIVSNGGELSLVYYNVLLRGLCNEGRTDDAIRLFEDLPLKGFHPDIVSCNTLLCGLCRENQWEEAIVLLAEMGQGRDIATYNILIDYLAQQGKFDAAFEVLEEIKRAGLKPVNASYNRILDPICKEGKVDFAVKCIDHMISNHCYANEGTYNALARLYKQGKALGGFILIQRLWNTHPLSRREFYNDVIQSLCKEGNALPAFQLLREMRKDGFVLNSYTHSSLIRGLCAEGMVDEAMEVVSLKDEYGYWPSMDNLNSLIVGLCKLRRTDLSCEVFYTMIEKGYKPNEKTYITLVRGIAYEGELEVAEEVLKELHQKQLLSPHAVGRICTEFDFEMVNRDSKRLAPDSEERNSWGDLVKNWTC